MSITEILNSAVVSELNWKNQVRAMSGYEAFTTFWSDFTIAESCGNPLHDIEDTFNRAFEGWKTDCKYMAELTLVLNHKSWVWADNDVDICKLYIRLYERARDWGYDTFKDDDLSYFYNTLD